MALRLLLPLVLLSALAFVACGDDDDSDDSAPTGPSATEQATTDAEDNSDGNGNDEVPPEEREPNTGHITIGDMVFDYEVTACEGSTDELARLAGPGVTEDGEPFWVEARWGLGGPVSVQVGVGIEDPTVQTEGEPHYQAQAREDAVSFLENGFSISFSGAFERVGSPDGETLDGTVDVSCLRD